jgi:hypothetical protein
MYMCRLAREITSFVTGLKVETVLEIEYYILRFFSK